MSYRSYAFTIRPSNGFPSNLDEKLTKLFKQSRDGICLVAEMEDDARHIHGQVWFPNPKLKGDVNKELVRFCKKNIQEFEKSEEYVLKRGTKIAYNDDFIINYTNKPDSIFIQNEPPEGEHTEYYPSQEEQDKVQAKSNAVDKKFHTWEIDFLEYWKQRMEDCDFSNPPQSVKLIDVAEFLSRQMFMEKKYNVIVDKKNRVQNCKSLYLYIKSKKCPKEFLTKEEWELECLIEEHL